MLGDTVKFHRHWVTGQSIEKTKARLPSSDRLMEQHKEWKFDSFLWTCEKKIIAYQIMSIWVFYYTGLQRRGQSCQKWWWGHHLEIEKRQTKWKKKVLKLYDTTEVNTLCIQFRREGHTFIFVFNGNFIVTLQLASEDTLHHQHQLIVCDVFIMDRDASNVVTQLGFDDQLAAQVQLAVHGVVWSLLFPLPYQGTRGARLKTLHLPLFYSSKFKFKHLKHLK